MCMEAAVVPPTGPVDVAIVTIRWAATTGDVAQGSGRLTVVSNADKLGTEQLTIAANSGNIVLANSQLTGGSIAGSVRSAQRRHRRERLGGGP